MPRYPGGSASHYYYIHTINSVHKTSHITIFILSTVYTVLVITTIFMLSIVYTKLVILLYSIYITVNSVDYYFI